MSQNVRHEGLVHTAWMLITDKPLVTRIETTCGVTVPTVSYVADALTCLLCSAEQSREWNFVDLQYISQGGVNAPIVTGPSTRSP